MKKKVDLDAFEKKIEKNANKLVTVSDRESKNIYSLIEKAKKNTSISLRINNYDLDKIKEKADTNGLPYQTLITTVLHRYINGDFFDKNEVIKTMKVFKDSV
jgi:predicted DNA binding CopG/RHH family protein